MVYRFTCVRWFDYDLALGHDIPCIHARIYPVYCCTGWSPFDNTPDIWVCPTVVRKIRGVEVDATDAKHAQQCRSKNVAESNRDPDFRLPARNTLHYLRLLECRSVIDERGIQSSCGQHFGSELAFLFWMHAKGNQLLPLFH